MVLSSESWIPPSLLVSSSKRKMKKRESRYCSFRLRRKFIILPLAAFIFTTMLLGTRVRVTLDLPPYTEKYLTVPSISGFLVNAANISVGSFNLKDTIKEYHSYLITTEEETEETEETQEISDSEAKDYSVLPPSNEEESNMDETFTNTKGLSSSEHPRKEEKDSDSLKNLEETEVLNDYRVPLINDTTFIAEMTNNIEGDPTFSSNIKDDKWKKNSDSTKNLEETIVSNHFDASPINVSTSFAAEMGDSTSKEGMSSNNIKDKQTYKEEKNSSSTRNLEETKVLDHIDDASTNISTSFVAGTDDTAKKPGTSSQNTGACNYGKGRWVADSKRPLYSGFKCKQWLSEMWACRLTQRTDFSYEGYRWQPQHCNLREFEPSTFFQRMRNKTIAFVGDSIGRQQFQSLLCMVTAGEWREDVEDVGKEFGLVKPLGAIRPDGVAYRFPKTNTTILFYWTSTLADLQPLNSSDHPSPHVAMHLDRPPTFLEQFIHRFNVLVLNTGHHWNRGKIKLHKWVLHVNDKPLEDGHLLAGIGNAKNFTLNSLVKWIDRRLVSQPELKVFFRTISPRHFRHGEWNSGGNCDNTIPLRGGSQVSEDESSDGLIASAVKGTRVQLLDITALSELRDEGHISRYSVKAKQGVNDCLHWCLPGIPDTWNEILFSML